MSYDSTSSSELRKSTNQSYDQTSNTWKQEHLWEGLVLKKILNDHLIPKVFYLQIDYIDVTFASPPNLIALICSQNVLGNTSVCCSVET